MPRRSAPASVVPEGATAWRRRASAAPPTSIARAGAGRLAHRRVDAAEALLDDFARLLDLVPDAVLVVDAAGRVVVKNTAADRLTARRDGLVVDRGVVRAIRPPDDAALQARIADAGTNRGAERPPLLVRRDGGQDLIVQICSLPGRPRPLFGAAGARIVIATELDLARAPEGAILQAAFGLTPSEARLTRLLAQGVRLTAAAARLGWQVGTARSRLKVIFAKTGTHRQAELVWRVLHTVPHL